MLNLVYFAAYIRKEWLRLGSMAKEDAMEDFVKLLNSCCSLFAPYVTSHTIEKEEQEKRRYVLYKLQCMKCFIM